jgi:hypothetical protein
LKKNSGGFLSIFSVSLPENILTLQESIDNLFNVVKDEGLYTKSKDEFYSKYYPDFDTNYHDKIF